MTYPFEFPYIQFYSFKFSVDLPHHLLVALQLNNSLDTNLQYLLNKWCSFFFQTVVENKQKTNNTHKHTHTQFFSPLQKKNTFDTNSYHMNCKIGPNISMWDQSFYYFIWFSSMNLAYISMSMRHFKCAGIIRYFFFGF